MTGYLSDEVGPALAAGRLDGAESSTGSILSNNYQAVAHYLPANVVLFLKTNTIAINRRAFDRLSSEQQHALREAASATLASALEAARPTSTTSSDSAGGSEARPCDSRRLAALHEGRGPRLRDAAPRSSDGEASSAASSS